MKTPTPSHTDYEGQQEQIDKAALVHCISEGCSHPAACRRVGVSLATFQHWLESDPEFAEKVADARSAIIREMEAMAYRCALKAAEDPRYLPALIFCSTHRPRSPRPHPSGPDRAAPNPRPATHEPTTPPRRRLDQ
ncbi:MAG TPA: hypothetical protein VFG50_10220 [Rhodothermales bacterium]|nr:hypothetical protein [Rhodothermales bacterium]